MNNNWYSSTAKRQRYQEAVMLLPARKYAGKTRAQRADDIKSYGPKRYEQEIKKLKRNLRYRQNYQTLRKEYNVKDARRLAHKKRETIKEISRTKEYKDVRSRSAIREKRKMWAIWAKTRTMPTYLKDIIEEVNKSEKLKYDDGYGYAIVYHHYVLNEELSTSIRRYRPDVEGLEDYVIASIRGR